MSEYICQYSGDREQAIVSYLYGDEGGFDVVERAAFDAHVAICERCSAELAAFEGVRTTLGAWSPPGLRSETHPVGSGSVGSGSVGSGSVGSGFSRIGPPAGGPHGGFSWRDIPAWAQVAAAMLCLGVGAGIANLNVRYDANGLQVRTGWSTGVPAPVAQTSQPVAGTLQDAAPWRAELTALEQRLRTDLRETPAATAANPAANSETLRRVRALVEDSERRQQTELALRLAEAVREVNAQRQADLVRIDRNIGAMQNNTGREMLRQRNEMLNYVSIRTAARP